MASPWLTISPASLGIGMPTPAHVEWFEPEL